jgi:RNA polymerase sigma factor (TIGR02999 family)
MSAADVTGLLLRAREGDDTAFDQVYEALYQELRRVARAQLRRHQRGTLSTGALINESYLRLIDQTQVDLESRTHFLALSARAMRQILVDYFRRKSAAKRGGPEVPLPLAEELVAGRERGEQFLALDQALTRLAEHDGRLASVVEMKFFGGMSHEEIGASLDIAPRTVRRDWFKAKAWLTLELGPDEEGPGPG